jgi:hypothetical protein
MFFEVYPSRDLTHFQFQSYLKTRPKCQNASAKKGSRVCFVIFYFKKKKK